MGVRRKQSTMSSEEAAKAEEAPKTEPQVPVTNTDEPPKKEEEEKGLTPQAFRDASNGISELVKVAYPDQDAPTGFFTICQGFICMWSLYTDWPGCCSVNDECTCLCCQGGAGYQCFTCVSGDADVSAATKSCETCISVGRCCDMTDGDQFVCCEESMVVIAYCCTRGAAKGKCKLGIFPEMISQVRQECCCDCRCQIPPGSPEKDLAGCVHPLGFSCCGKVLYGEGWGSAREKGGGSSTKE